MICHDTSKQPFPILRFKKLFMYPFFVKNLFPTPPKKKPTLSIAMAFHFHQSTLFTLLLSLIFITTPSHSLNCSSQKLANNLYTNCTNLPTLDSSLHWTHDTKTSTLVIAFVAPPAKPNGWIAWAINPTQHGMAGSQALIAFKNSNGSMNVKTYNISSYSDIVEGKIAFDVTDLKAEYSGGSMKIYATLKLPKEMTQVNHVWQVGSEVMEGMPAKHEFQPANLKAMGKLQLKMVEKAKSSSNDTTTATNTTTGTSVGSPVIAPSPSPNNTNEGYRNRSIMYVFFVLIVGALISN
uniref:auxin-induced in root cultures protein 12-like n=1 Tax=Erigeron canadensis TaxID=72917 RepID=UPI001CB949C2|nr:auxin-induced in root cultures protein 12-like [Erigeron canadensis]